MSQIHTITYGTTTIAWCPVINDGEGRRAAERQAVDSLVRHLLGDEAVEHKENGAPCVSSSYISITHSRRLAAIAVDRVRPIGIDAEEWRPALLRVVSRYMSPREMQLFDTPRAMLHLWTVKEAVYKVLGEQAYDFDTAIAVYDDTAEACGMRFDIHSTDINETHLTLVVPGV